MAAVTDQLGALNSDYEVDGLYTLPRFFRHAAAVATDIQPINIAGVQEVTAEGYSWGIERDSFQQGGGAVPRTTKRNPKYSLNISIKGGYVGTFLTNMLGQSWSTYFAVPLRFPITALITLELVVRKADNESHLYSKCYQDLILQEFNVGSPMEDEIVTIPFMSYHDPFILNSGYHLVYDKFSGDGSTTDFSLTGTPVALVDTNELAKEDWELDDMVFVKTKLSTDDEGTRQRTGISQSSGTLTYTTAPASGSEVEALWAEAN